MPAQVRNVTANRETQPTEVSFIGESNGVVSRTGTFKNIETFSESGREYFSQAVLNYSELKKGTKDGLLAFVENSQGTAWLPFSLGGTYYPSGLYVWDEPTQTWASSRTKVAEGIDAATGSGGVTSYNDLTDLPTIPTQITDAEITALGYVKTDNDTQLTDFDITALGYIKTDTNTQLSDSDIAALGYIKTDTNTQLSDSDIAALGYIKTDTNTQLSDSDIAALGYIKTDTNTQLSDADITALGYIKTDTNTQLSQADIELMGFSTIDNDTQLSDADIAALGYIKTDTNTQLSQAEIEAMGFSTIDNDTQLTDSEIEALGYLKTPAVLPLAKGGALNLQQELLAKDAQPALTILAVGPTTSGRVQGCSLSDGNVVQVYASGADYNSQTVLYREFLQAGEPICFSGVSQGAIITSTGGFYGVSEQINGGNESPMPLLSLGLAFTDTFFYAFRNSESPTGSNRGEVTVTCGPLPAEVTLLRNGNPVTADGVLQENIALEPFESTLLLTTSNQEFQITATSPVMACVQARMGTGDERFYDARLIMPLTNDGITYPRSGQVSAPYDDTVVDYFVRDNVTGTFTVNPNSPVDFDGTTGATDADYEPNGATRVKAKGLISAYSGADSAGLEASPLMPVSAMSQIVAQPFFIDDSGDGGNSGVAIASPYEGTAKVYEWNSTTGVADLAYTVPLTRGSNGAGVTLTTVADQNIPCSGIIANEGTLAGDPSYVPLVGDLGAGYIVSDVPITVVLQNALPTHTPTVRSQNGTTTTGLVSDDDETLSLGFTPADVKAEFTRDLNGFLRKRVIDGTGTLTYELV